MVAEPRREPDTRRPYSPADDAVIVSHYSQEPLARIALRLGRPVPSVRERAARLVRQGRLARRSRCYHRPWTALELEFLCERRGDMADAALARRLGRTVRAVEVRGKRLHVPAKANWLSAAQVGAILGRDRKTVVRLGQRGRLRLRRSVVRAGRHRTWRCDILELERFIAEERDAYDATRITEEPWRGMARCAQAGATWAGGKP